MQLDDNRIVIRERSYLDVMDLALRVIRRYAGPLALASAAGIFPAMALNALLLQSLGITTEADFQTGLPGRYLWWMSQLVIWEIPLATAPITLCLGQALFADRPQFARLGRSFLGSLPQMLLYQVILRGLLVPWVVTWFLVFAVWPYLSEVILLERNPMRRGRPGQMTTYRRARALHEGYLADFFVRWLGTMVLAMLLTASIWLTLWFLRWRLVGEWRFQGVVYTVFYPLALWLVVGYFAVVRFLGYLDLRIRREGWEVELLMRAEGARLTRQWA